MKEAETFRDLFKEREAVRKACLASEKSLLEKKDKLFKSKEKDVHKWGSSLNGIELERVKEKLVTDRAFAFSHMLAKET